MGGGGQSSALESTIGGVFVAGLLVWYAGGGDAIDALVAGGALFAVTAVGALVAFAIGALAARALGAKKALGHGAVLAFSVAIALSGVLALANRSLDRSSRVTRPALIVGRRVSSKGPAHLELESDGVRFDAAVTRAPGCGPSGPATVTTRAGALGMRWVVVVECAPPGR